MLEPWRARLLRRLDAAALAGKPARAAAKAAIEAGPMRADVDAIGYRIVRDWRERLQTGLTARFDADLADEVPGLSYRIANTRWDSVLTRLLDEQPAAWLPPGHADWPAFELAMLDAVLDDLSAHGGIARARWSDHNRADITHPFARLLPSLKHWLAAPADALPGDTQTVRAQAPSFGASERMVVAPGQEALGLFQMPGGQSGHPLSPYFLAGHADWVSGRPAPLIPGAAAHRLTLKPVR
jgi:penicillin amidase